MPVGFLDSRITGAVQHLRDQSLASSSSVIFEWAALLPLVIYLASYRYSYKLVGHIALTGEVRVSFFPKIGILRGIADLLIEGHEFLDQASSIGELQKKTWDVTWGSVFPCANGAASHILAQHALRDAMPVQPMPETFVSEEKDTTSIAIVQDAEAPKINQRSKQEPQTQHRRHQTLHLIQYTVTSKRRNHNRPSDLPYPSSRTLRLLTESALILLLVASAAICLLFSLFGTAASVLTSLFLRLTCYFINVRRPPAYLTDNEAGNIISGCFLLSIHQNASTWYLFTGPRGIVDHLVNKPMVLSIDSAFFGRRGTRIIAFFLQSLGFLQLAAVTYTAAHKHWDGIALLVLICIAWASEQVFRRDNVVAKQWLRSEGVEVRAASFRFSGRTPMLGAIQLFGHGVSGWMDEILQPSDRRTVWLDKLAGRGDEEDVRKQESMLGEFDRQWVQRNCKLSFAAAERLTAAFKGNPMQA